MIRLPVALFWPGALPYGDAWSISAFTSAPVRMASPETSNKSSSAPTMETSAAELLLSAAATPNGEQPAVLVVGEPVMQGRGKGIAIGSTKGV